MKALQIVGKGQIEIQQVEKQAPAAGEALVQLKAAALNRRDHWIREGKYPNIQFHTTLGSDGCGEVVEVGSSDHNDWIGKQVVINPNINWGENPACQGSDYQVLGMPTDGTLAEFITVPVHRLTEKPKHLSTAEAAALPLAGLTAYRALFNHGRLVPGQKILITGIGGGVSQTIFLLAKALAVEISVTSGSEEKLAKAKEMGASHGFNYHEEWSRQAMKAGIMFDLIIDSVGGPQLNDLIKLTNPSGRIVFYGATTGLTDKLDLYRLFWNQITLQGSTMGNDQEFQSMIEFVNKYQLHPVIDSQRPFAQVIDAFESMRNSEQQGKLVVTF
ncbi:MAG: putative zinc-type alcohol dehydrogenase-like protein YogA [Cyclobacteriaceae bacterium]|nr:MAG: putative zinc-type alcohol dehydrogenase-like protein YogA [Cyclobacteriaceae bacterium]